MLYRLLRLADVVAVASPARHVALRTLAAVCALGLIAPMFLIQLFPGHTGWSPGLVLGLFAFGAPSGVLFGFARSGSCSWQASLLLPLVAIAQAVSVLAALEAFPHDPAIHIGAAVTASWSVVLTGYALGRARRHAA
jgi:hypothetical protein